MRDFLRIHRRRIILLALVLAAGLGLGLPERIAGRTRGGMGTVFVPAQIALGRLTAAVGRLVEPLVAAWRRGRRVTDLEAEIARLRNQNAQLHQRQADLERQLAEAHTLRNALPAAELVFTAAPVIGRDSCTWADSLTVGKGARSGIRPGQLVVTPTDRLIAAGADDALAPGDMVLDGACVVGRVTAVAPFHSVVRLVTDPASVMRARVVGVRDGRTVETGAGVLQGTEGSRSRLRLEYVRRRDDVRPGDLVLTAGYGGILPAPLLVGRVEAVEPSTMPLLVRVTVAPQARIEHLDRVIVVHERGRQEKSGDSIPGPGAIGCLQPVPSGHGLQATRGTPMLSPDFSEGGTS